MLIGIVQEDYQKVVNAEIRKLSDRVANGQCETYEDYKAKCARISGLKQALELFNDVAKRHGELEDGE